MDDSDTETLDGEEDAWGDVDMLEFEEMMREPPSTRDREKVIAELTRIFTEHSVLDTTDNVILANNEESKLFRSHGGDRDEYLKTVKHYIDVISRRLNLRATLSDALQPLLPNTSPQEINEKVRVFERALYSESANFKDYWRQMHRKILELKLTQRAKSKEAKELLPELLALSDVDKIVMIMNFIDHVIDVLVARNLPTTTLIPFVHTVLEAEDLTWDQKVDELRVYALLAKFRLPPHTISPWRGRNPFDPTVRQEIVGLVANSLAKSLPEKRQEVLNFVSRLEQHIYNKSQGNPISYKAALLDQLLRRNVVSKIREYIRPK